MDIKKIVNIIKPFVDKNNPRFQVNFIYYDVDSNCLVGINDKIMIKVDLDDKLELNENCYLDIYNLNTKAVSISNLQGVQVFRESDIHKFISFRKILLDKYTPLKKVISADFCPATIIMNVGVLVNKEVVVKFDKRYEKLKFSFDDYEIRINDYNSVAQVDFINPNINGVKKISITFTLLQY